MASITVKSDSVRFDKPQDWTKWSREARIYAKNLDLWAYIDPENKAPWPVKPVRPNIADYPKKLVRIETRQSSSNTLESTPTLEQVDISSTPRTVGEMTAEGRANYQFDINHYMYEDKRYKDHRTNVTTYSNWIVSTVGTSIRESACDEDTTIDDWYTGLQRIGAPYMSFEKVEARTKYQAAIKPLLKMPRNFNDWLTTWTTAMAEGLRTNCPETKDADIWARDLIKALQVALPSWANTFLGNNRTKIADNSLNFRDVAADIHEHWMTHSHQYSGKILKGSFLSYAEEEDAPTSYDEVSDADSTKGSKEQRKRSVRTQKKDQPKRKRAETFETVSRTVCKGCKMPGHSLLECFYVFEEKAPEGWKPRQAIVRLVEGKIKQDSALAGEIARFKKGKVRFTDTPTDS